MINPADKTKLVNKTLPEFWKCPHCNKRNVSGAYSEEILMTYKKVIQQCEYCGALHYWELELTDDFKAKVVDMLMKGKV